MSDTSLVFSIIGKDKTAAALGSASSRISKLKVGLVAGFGAISAAVGTSINKAADFDKTIRQVGAAANVSGDGLKDLSKLALKLGADTSFSAQEAAQAMLELTKAGITPAQIKAGVLSETLTLAAAGELDLGRAAEITSNALAAFSLSAEDSARVAAALAGGANASTASVESLAQGLGNVGAVAKQAGLSINDTVAILSMFDDNAIKGAEGGTQLKSMLLALLSPSNQAARVMKEIGFSTRDANGQMKPMGRLIDDLSASLKGMGKEQRDAAMKIIFGRYAISGANILLDKGSKKLAEYKLATEDMAAAQKMAETNTSGATGAFEQFWGAVESLQISFGLHLLPAVTKVVGALTDLVNFVGSAVDPAMSRLKGFADKVAPAFDTMRRSISDAFKGLDLSGVEQALMTSSRSWAQAIIGGVQQGFDTGDWSGLGSSLGSGIGNALRSTGNLAVTFYGWIGEQIREVDWVSLGFEMGKQAPSLMAGLALGILNFDLAGMLSGLGDHWFDVILGVLAIAFLPGKFVGAIAGLLGRIPFAGSILSWGVRSIHRASVGIAAAAGRLATSFFSGLAGGLGRVFPAAGTLMEQGLTGIVHLVTGGAPRIGQAVAGWGRSALSALAPVPGRLAAKAGELIGGFLGGLGRNVGRVDAWMGGFGARIASRVGSLASTLYRHGLDFIQGFINGITAKAASIPGIIRDKVVGVAKSALHGFGLFGSPSRLTMRYGRWFSQGFAIGIKDKTKDVIDNVKKLMDKLRAKVEAVREFAREIREAFRTMADPTSMSFGAGDGNLVEQMRAKAAQAVEFARGIAQLRKMGLNELTLSQIRDAGPEGGFAAMQQLLNPKHLNSIREINSLVAQIDKAGKSLGDSEAKKKFGFGPSGPQTVKVKSVKSSVKLSIDFGNKGAENALVEAIRKAVRHRGGDVQVVFGK